MRGTLRALVTLSRTTRNTAIRRYTAASTSTHPRDSRLDLTTTVLLDALPAVSQYGFSKHAYIHAAGAQTDLDRRSRTVDTLFPGPDSTFEAALFQTWNSVSNHAAIRATSPQDIIAILRANGTLDGETQRPVRINAQLSEEEKRKALAKVAELMLDRLRLSWDARPHLQQGLAAVSTASPETSTWHSVFPHKTVLPDLPTPRPLLEMAGGAHAAYTRLPRCHTSCCCTLDHALHPHSSVVQPDPCRTRHGRHRHRAHSALVIHPVGAVGQSWLARCV
ncbi:hypothetical protein L1887_54829 [Cichorium endivia]|nr:hypothetical protein L1887_54829 [Cichorium endivia]